MKTTIYRLFYTFGVIVLMSSSLISCKSAEVSSTPAYKVTMDSASPGRSAISNIEDILIKNHYTINQVGSSSHRTTYLRTDWVPKAFLDDELKSDITAIRTRIVVESNQNSIRFEGQTEYLTADNIWVRGEVSDSRKEYFNEITYEIRNRLHGGLNSTFYSSQGF
jgi:hypothetical protein